jgi:hypothetical protein
MISGSPALDIVDSHGNSSVQQQRFGRAGAEASEGQAAEASATNRTLPLPLTFDFDSHVNCTFAQYFSTRGSVAVEPRSTPKLIRNSTHEQTLHIIRGRSHCRR